MSTLSRETRAWHVSARDRRRSGRLPGVSGVLVVVCVVHRVKPDRGVVGRTAIDKRPVAGPVAVETLGLAGDVQCDPEHGGPQAALYAYAREEADRWAAELGREVPPGLFGENLAVTGLAVTDAVVGTRWRIGDEVVVGVTAPRIPCATFGDHLGEPRWVKRFSERGDVGAYLRVDVPGLVRAGDVIEILDVPEHGLTVRQVFAAHLGRVPDPAPLAAALAGGELSGTVEVLVRRALARVAAAG